MVGLPLAWSHSTWATSAWPLCRSSRSGADAFASDGLTVMNVSRMARSDANRFTVPPLFWLMTAT